MIVNDDSSIVIKVQASFTDDARVVIYDRHMFIVLATALVVGGRERGSTQEDSTLASKY